MARFTNKEYDDVCIAEIMEDCQIYDSKFKDWLEERKYLKYKLFDSKMYGKLYRIWDDVMHNDQDHFIVVTGKEGKGKSVKAWKDAALLDPTFDSSHLCYDKNQFFDWVLNGKRGQVVWLDEGVLFLFSREAMSNTNRALVKMITLMRQCGLIVMICIPSFRNVETKIRDSRVDTLIDCRAPTDSTGRKRYLYTVYNKKAVKIVSEVMRQKPQFTPMDVKCPAGSWFKGVCTNYIPEVNDLTVEKYKELKLNSLKESIEELKNSTGTARENQESRRANAVYVKLSKLQSIMGLSMDALYQKAKRKEIPARKIGKNWMIKREFITNFLEKQRLKDAEVPL